MLDSTTFNYVSVSLNPFLLCGQVCVLKQKGVGEAKRFMFVYEAGTVIFSGRAHTQQLYLSKQRSTFLPLLDSIAAFMLAVMFER